jgi:hypothetical protein
MSTVIIAIVWTIAVLVFAVALALIEAKGGFLGDSSMLPGILLGGITVLAIIFAIGFLIRRLEHNTSTHRRMKCLYLMEREFSS